MSYGWEAIYKTEQGDASTEVVPWVTDHGRTIPCEDPILIPNSHGRLRPEKVGAIMAPDTPLRYLLITVSDTAHSQSGWIMRTSFPFLFEGLPASLQVKEVVSANVPVEAYVRTESRDGNLVSFFDPTYFVSRNQYQADAFCEFSLAGLAYDLYPAEEDWVDVTRGPLLESERARRRQEDPAIDVAQIKSVRLWLKGTTLYVPNDGEPDMCSIRSTVETVESFKVHETLFYRVRVPILRTETPPISIYLYASEPTLGGYVPKVGQEIEGTVWMQGYPTAQRDVFAC